MGKEVGNSSLSRAGDRSRMGAPRNPTVTIVVPTYQRPDLLIDSLSAIKKQTFEDFVVLVCDNSPTAEGRPVVESLEDPRFQYVVRPRNLGMLVNALEGFKAARTPYVMEVDDDDLLRPRCLELLLAPFAENPDLTIVFGDLVVIDDSLDVLPRKQRVKYLPSLDFLPAGRHQPFTKLAAYGYVFLMASVLRKDCIDWDAVPLSAATAYDRYLTLAASRGDAPGYFVKEPVMAYRVHERSDGLRFTTRSLNGALGILTAEAAQAEQRSRHWIELEIVRTRLRLYRAFRAGGDRAEAMRQVRHLAHPAAIKALTYMSLRQYVPQRLRLARDVTRDLLRPSARPQTMRK